jgi:hypothetical protein
VYYVLLSDSDDLIEPRLPSADSSFGKHSSTAAPLISLIPYRKPNLIAVFIDNGILSSQNQTAARLEHEDNTIAITN